MTERKTNSSSPVDAVVLVARDVLVREVYNLIISLFFVFPLVPSKWLELYSYSNYYFFGQVHTILINSIAYSFSSLIGLLLRGLFPN